ncbi:MAG TPA: mechanosensitive ion channel domain-containing protein [Caulobacter sp.]|nr:mechanosensitive ion channel domain-containing protein [Caulobacter sp.]
MAGDFLPRETRELTRDIRDIGEVKLWTFGKSNLTVGGLVSGVLIVVLFWLLSRLVQRLFRRFRESSPQAAPPIYIVEKVATYGLSAIGVFMGISAFGLDLSSLSLFAGALGVGLGFGLQGVVKEFISGLVLIFDRLIRIGDYLELQTGERGVVAEIGARATRLRNNDDLDVLVPNSRLIEAPVTNWTHQNSARRMHVPFRVAYGTSKEAVRDAVLKAAHEVPFTLEDTPRRKTQVWLVGFGESGLMFELVVWPTLEAVKRPNAAHAAYTWAIEDALRKGGFEIPFPQQELRLRGLFGQEGDAARDALRLKPPTRRSTKAGEDADGATHNDAAEDLVRGAEEDAMNPVPGTDPVVPPPPKAP